MHTTDEKLQEYDVEIREGLATSTSKSFSPGFVIKNCLFMLRNLRNRMFFRTLVTTMQNESVEIHFFAC